MEGVGTIPGKRESRRFEGLYMLRQDDLLEQREHDDAVAFGGWSIDLHPADGAFSEHPGCNQLHGRGIFQLPYRCLVGCLSLPGASSQDDIVGQLLGPDKDKLFVADSRKEFLFSKHLKIPVDTIFTAATEINTIITKLNQETLLGDRTVDSWVKEAVSQCDAAIAKAA